jgi:hypothetical protein
LTNVVHSISVETKDAEGSALNALDVHNYVFAPGAIVDIAVTSSAHESQ